MNSDVTTLKVDADIAGFTAAMKAASESTRDFGKIFTSTIKDAVLSGKSFEETLRAMASRISTMALNSAFAPIESSISSLMNNLLSGLLAPKPFANGGAFSASGPVPFSRGGIVSAPTTFGFRGGTGLMGEAGPEVILPLARGPDGRLGISGAGTGGAVNVVFNISSPDVAGFKRSEGQLTAMLARSVQRGQRRL